MTVLTSLLIATQGLIPSPTPLSIGTQGLLQAAEAPPPVVKPPDLPGGGGRKEKERIVVVVRGVRARLTSSNDVHVVVSAQVISSGTSAQSQSAAPTQHISLIANVGSNTTNISANRLKPQISTTLDVVGCAEDDIALVRLMAQAALEEYYLQSMIEAYDD